MNEASFWSTRLRPKLQAEYPGIFLERIENGVAQGTPDVHYCYNGNAGWIENKFRESTPRGGTVVLGGKGLRQEQIAWWLGYMAAGGSGFIAVGVGPITWVIPARPFIVRAINDWTFDEFRTYAPLNLRAEGLW